MNEVQKNGALDNPVRTADRVRKYIPSPKARYTVQRAGLTVEEAAEYLGLSRTAAYDAVRAGTIPAFRVGRRWIVPIDKLKEKFALTINPWGSGE